MAPVVSLELADDLIAVRKLVQMVLLLSVKDQASEVFFEPQLEQFRLAYKIGDLSYDMVPAPPADMVPAPPALAGQIINVLRSMVGLDRMASGLQPTVQFELCIDTRLVPATVTFHPTPFGEAATVSLAATPDDAGDAARLLETYYAELRGRKR